MFKLENTAKTLTLCTLPLFAVCLIRAATRAFYFCKLHTPHNISYNMLMSNFQCKILESLRLMLLIIVFFI